MKRASLACLALVTAAGANGAPFADPTRPPGAFNTSGPATAAPASARLESVLIGPDRRIAVIGGQQVTVGGKFGDGEVIRITESEVLIRKAGAVESLKLFPQTVKREPSGPQKRKQP